MPRANRVPRNQSQTATRADSCPAGQPEKAYTRGRQARRKDSVTEVAALRSRTGGGPRRLDSPGRRCISRCRQRLGFVATELRAHQHQAVQRRWWSTWTCSESPSQRPRGAEAGLDRICLACVQRGRPRRHALPTQTVGRLPPLRWASLGNLCRAKSRGPSSTLKAQSACTQMLRQRMRWPWSWIRRPPGLGPSAAPPPVGPGNSRSRCTSLPFQTVKFLLVYIASSSPRVCLAP